MSKKREDKLYEQEFGHIPNDQLDRITYILGKKADNKKFNDMIAAEARKIKRLKTTKLEFTMWKIVRPSARPRFNRRGAYIKTYVPRAKENGDWFEEFAKENNLPFIDTPCTLNITVYEKTPSSFSIKNKVLAELGLIRPWRRTGDFDNYAKSVADSIQHGMLADDCLVIDSTIRIFYSIKPRTDVSVIYYNKHPDEIIFPNKGGK